MSANAKLPPLLPRIVIGTTVTGISAVHPPADEAEITDVLQKAKSLAGLSGDEASRLLSTSDPDHAAAIFEAARWVKDEIYGKRLVLFAPLYVSNYCVNTCLYCAFNRANRGLRRRALTRREIAAQVEALLRQGHKRLLLVAGESSVKSSFDYILDAVDAVYEAGRERHIRRVNVNIAPLDDEQFRELARHPIGTYQIFQETYHRPTYEEMHVRGPKADFEWRLGTPARAMGAGISDVGIGALFGLYDYRFEVASLIAHAEALDREYGAGPHTISVPRLEPAEGSGVAARPPHPVSDEAFLRIIAVLRLAVPYAGIILSTRESREIRRAALSLGVSQISAGSRTHPGGYRETGEAAGAQFQLGDHRTLDEVVRDLLEMGFLPSFCTGCYRKGRVGKDFMDLAKPGLIKRYCLPNGLLTLQEYLEDHASPETRTLGMRLIARHLSEVPTERLREKTGEHLRRIAKGERDLYF